MVELMWMHFLLHEHNESAGEAVRSAPLHIFSRCVTAAADARWKISSILSVRGQIYGSRESAVSPSALRLFHQTSQAWTRMNAGINPPALILRFYSRSARKQDWCTIEGVWTSNDEPVLQWKGFQTILTAVIICDAPHIKHKQSCLKHRLYELRRAGIITGGRLGSIRRWNISLRPQLYLTSERN